VLPDDHKLSCKAAYASGELNGFLACVECGVTQMRETSLLCFDKLKAMSNQLQASSHEAKELQRNEVRAMAPSLNTVNASSLELFKSYQLLRSKARHVDTSCDQPQGRATENPPSGGEVGDGQRPKAERGPPTGSEDGDDRHNPNHAGSSGSSSREPRVREAGARHANKITSMSRGEANDPPKDNLEVRGRG